MTDDPFVAEWYDVKGTVIGFLGEDDDVMVVSVAGWRTHENPHREGGWVSTDQGRFPLIALRWSGHDYKYDGEFEDFLPVGEEIEFTTNRKEQEEYSVGTTLNLPLGP